MSVKKNIAAVFTAGLMSLCANGAGYQIVEQGASNQGTAMAGSTANANADASAAFWNPSAATAVDLDVGETRVDATLSFIMPTLSFQDKGSQSIIGGPVKDNDCAVNSVVPNIYGVHRLTEDIYLTMSSTAPYGLESRYGTNWVGRAQALRSYLMTLDFNPSIVYKINDWISINGGVSAQYAYCSLTQYSVTQVGGMLIPGVLDMTGDSWGIGGNAGFTINYLPDGRFGFQWRSKVEHTLTGTYQFNGIQGGDIKADMCTPDTFTVGIYQRLRGPLEKFAIMAEYAYTRWSVFDELYVDGIQGSTAIKENWKDTSRVAVGLHYYPIENLVLRIGSAFDESPVHSAQDKTPRIPCEDRVWLSCGIGYTFGQFSVDVGYSYILLVGDSNIDRSEGSFGTVKGSYGGHIHVLSAQVGFKF